MEGVDPLRVALIAGEAAGGQALKFALSVGVDVAFVCAAEEETTIHRLAAQAGVPVFTPESIGGGALVEAILDRSVDLLLNVHSLSLLPGELVTAPRVDSFNLHPGPLPSYGGLGAPSWAIYNGERRYAVTLHWMTEGLDDGDIAYEAWFDVAPDATGFTLSATCAKQGLDLIRELVDQARQDPTEIPRRAQDGIEPRLYRRSEIPNDGMVDWSRDAAQLERFVRASSYRPFASPWGEPETTLGGRVLGIVSASLAAESAPDGRPFGTVIALTDGGLGVVTGDGVLRVDRVGLDGDVLNAADLLAPEQFLGD